VKVVKVVDPLYQDSMAITRVVMEVVVVLTVVVVQAPLCLHLYRPTSLVDLMVLVELDFLEALAATKVAVEVVLFKMGRQVMDQEHQVR
jgi:hypothetical protein